MKSIIEELQKYDLIKPLAEFKPLCRISHIEIQPVKEHDDYCEPCAHGDEDFLSVYVRYDPSANLMAFGGVDCIADCHDFNGAAALALLISSLLGVTVVGGP